MWGQFLLLVRLRAVRSLVRFVRAQHGRVVGDLWAAFDDVVSLSSDSRWVVRCSANEVIWNQKPLQLVGRFCLYSL